MVKSYSIWSVAKTFNYRMKIFRTLLCQLHRGYCTCAVHHEQSLVSALFKVSVGHLFYDLEYGKSLEFWIQKSVRTLTVSVPAPYGVGSARRKFSWPYNKSFIKLTTSLTKLVRSRWLEIGLVFFFVCVFFLMDLDFARSENTQNNSVDVQPSWPYAWSVTYICINGNLLRVARSF